MEAGIPLHRDAVALSKLSGEPVEVEVSDAGESAKAWLHPVSALERNHIRASSSEAYKLWKKEGGDTDEARFPVSGVIATMTVYFALKCGKERKSNRFFNSQEEAVAFQYAEILRLYQLYTEHFELTDEEWGNYLRARKSGISPALPTPSRG